MPRILRLLPVWAGPICALAGCTPGLSQAQKADLAACTAQANAQYQQNTVNLLGRTQQTGLLYPATPNHVFDAEAMGAEHARQSQISQCMQNGNAQGTDLGGPPPIVPHIVSQ